MPPTTPTAPPHPDATIKHDCNSRSSSNNNNNRENQIDRQQAGEEPSDWWRSPPASQKQRRKRWCEMDRGERSSSASVARLARAEQTEADQSDKWPRRSPSGMEPLDGSGCEGGCSPPMPMPDDDYGGGTLSLLLLLFDNGADGLSVAQGERGSLAPTRAVAANLARRLASQMNGARPASSLPPESSGQTCRSRPGSSSASASASRLLRSLPSKSSSSSRVTTAGSESANPVEQAGQRDCWLESNRNNSVSNKGSGLAISSQFGRPPTASTPAQDSSTPAGSEVSETGVKSLANGPLNGNNDDCGARPELEQEQEGQQQQHQLRKVIGRQRDTKTTTTMTRRRRKGDTRPEVAPNEPQASSAHEQRLATASLSPLMLQPRRLPLQALPVANFSFLVSSLGHFQSEETPDESSAPNIRKTTGPKDQDQKEQTKRDLLEDETRVGPPKPDDASCGRLDCCSRRRGRQAGSAGEETSGSVLIREATRRAPVGWEMQMSPRLGVKVGVGLGGTGSGSGRGASSKWRSGKMQPLNGRQLIVSGSFMLILLSLLATFNWGNLFRSEQLSSNACSSSPSSMSAAERAWHCGGGRTGGGPSGLTIAASAANPNSISSNNHRQQQFSGQTPLDYEISASTTRMPPAITTTTSPTTAAGTSSSSTIVANDNPTTGTPQLANGPPSEDNSQQQVIMTTEQTTATLSAPATTPASSLIMASEASAGRRRNEEQAATTTASTTTTTTTITPPRFDPQQQQQSKSSLQKPKKFSSAKFDGLGQHKLVIKGKLRPGPIQMGGSPASERRDDARLQTLGWRAIESSPASNNQNEAQSGASVSSNLSRPEPELIVGRRQPLAYATNQTTTTTNNPQTGNQILQVPSTQQKESTSSTSFNQNNHHQASQSRTRPNSQWDSSQSNNSSSGWSIDSTTSYNQLNDQMGRSESARDHSMPPPGIGTATGGVDLPYRQQQQQQPEQALDTASQNDRHMLEKALREALDDLATSAAGEPSAKIRRPPLQPQASTPQDRFPVPMGLSVLDLRHFQRHHQPQAQAQQQQMPTASSQSAPSISLPPISHFLTPRNPFRLFASASSPVASRYWPMFGASHSTSSSQSSNHQRHPPNRWFSNDHFVTNSHAMNQPQLQHDRRRPLSFDEQPAALELESISSQLHNQVMAPMSLSETLFAHSQSAEQLEKLVRAASQAGHLPRNSQPILPAIVSGPGGQTFPGFYIPALDQDSSSSASSLPNRQAHESTASSFNHMHQMGSPYIAHQDSMTSASSHGDSSANAGGGGGGGSGGLFSTIPGTDYVLHPDEVRAMIQIGESAWQKQQQQQHQTSASSTHQVTSNGQHQAAPVESGHLWQRPGEQPMDMMQENHLENLRNYAYVESIGGGDRGAGGGYSNEHLQGASSATNERQLAGANGTTRQDPRQQQQQLLGLQLNRALMRARSKAMPAIIRVNDQDYVHWPLIQVGQDAQRTQLGAQKASSSGMGSLAFSSSQNNAVRHHHNNNNHHQQQQQVAFDRSPLRLSTQLTPNEIRQVEDSILETLVMAQTMQHQQKMMEALHAAASNKHSHRGQQLMPGGGNQKSGWLFKSMGNNGNGGFFSRRKRRRRNSANASAKQRPSSSMAPAGVSSSAQQHLMSILPLLNAAAINPVTLFPAGPNLASPSSPASLPKMIRSIQEPTVAMGSGSGGNQHMTAVHDESTNDLQQAGESKMSKRLPTVMADQDTNKAQPSSSHPDSLSAAASISSGAALRSFLGEASERLSRGNETRAKQTFNADWGHQSTPTDATFGSRVRPISGGGSSSSASGERNAKALASQDKKTHEDDDADDNDNNNDDQTNRQSLRTKPTTTQEQQLELNKQLAASSKLQNQFVTFVPIQNNRNKQISFYMNGLSNGQQREAASSGAGEGANKPKQADRFNPVDWPGMLSDADYFPAGQSSERQARNHERLAKLHNNKDAEEDNIESSHGSKLSPTDSDAPGAAGGLASAQSKPPRMTASQEERTNESNDQENGDDDDDDDHEHEPVDGNRQQRQQPPRQPKRAAAATIQVIQPPSTRRGNFVTGQTKLQFAQDYQAREGVPIYNNNVRVAGALDRQRNGLVAIAANG